MHELRCLYEAAGRMPVDCSSYRHGPMVFRSVRSIGLSWLCDPCEDEEKTEALRECRPEPNDGHSACSVGQTNVLE
jgi:hypothetical protein